MKLWDEIKSGGETALLKMRDEAISENQQLEFKQKTHPAKPELSDEDKKNFGASLSGLSNASGGVLIWGVSTAKAAGDEAVIDELVPIGNVSKFAHLLEGLLPTYLSPPNTDVEILTIPSEKAPESGYVAVRIGSSNHRPHMSMAPNHRRYYLRVGGATLTMVDFQVRDMLRIKSSPVLKIGRSYTHEMSNGPIRTAGLALSIYNVSEITAMHPYLLIRREAGRGPFSASPMFSQMQQASDQWLGFWGVEYCIIHPGIEMRAAVLRLYLRPREGLGEPDIRVEGQEKFRVVTDHPPIVVDVRVGCENTPARELAVKIGAGELERMSEDILRSGRAFHVAEKL